MNKISTKKGQFCCPLFCCLIVVERLLASSTATNMDPLIMIMVLWSFSIVHYYMYMILGAMTTIGNRTFKAIKLGMADKPRTIVMLMVILRAIRVWCIGPVINFFTAVKTRDMITSIPQ